MIYSAIQQLIDYSIQNGLMTKDDELVIRNQLMNALHVYDWQDEKAPATDASVDELLAPLVDYACQNGVIEDTTNNRDLFDTLLMGIVTPLPREIIRDFHAAYEKSILPSTAPSPKRTRATSPRREQAFRPLIPSASSVPRTWALPATKTIRQGRTCARSRSRSTASRGICSIRPTATTTSTASCSITTISPW